jgi:hypothetical protein
MSTCLKDVEPKKRFDHLLIELEKMNKWMERYIQSVVKKSNIKGAYRFNYHGLVMPLE